METVQTEGIPQQLTLDEVCERMRLSRHTIIRLCDAGELDAWQQGRRWRISEPSVVEYWNKRREANRKRAAAARERRKEAA